MENLKNQDVMERIAQALERLSPPLTTTENIDKADAFVWNCNPDFLQPVKQTSYFEICLLKGIDSQKNILLENTIHFSKGLPANNALLWGSRGSGKSSLVKAVHNEVNKQLDDKIVLVEIQREDINSITRLLRLLCDSNRRFIVFCDDLSFEEKDTSYKSLKSILEGGIEGRPKNVLFYATSNRRHMLSRRMIENESSTAINPAEAVEEKVSLSDRFGLWLGFHNINQDTFFEILEGYVEEYGLNISKEQLHQEAIEWSVTRGSRSGRVAWQYICNLAGRQEKKI